MLGDGGQERNYWLVEGKKIKMVMGGTKVRLKHLKRPQRAEKTKH